MSKNLIVYCLMLSLLFVALGQDWGLSETARSAGMANAFSAVGDGAYSLSSNPAGLYVSPRHSFLMTYSKDYSGLDFGSMYQASLMYSPLNEGRFTWGLGANIFAEDVYEMASGSAAFGGRVFNIGRGQGYFTLFAVANIYRVNYNEGGFYYDEHEDRDPADDPIFRDGFDKLSFGADVAFMMKYRHFSFGGRIANLNEPNLSIQDTEAGIIPRKARVGVSYNIMDIITPSVDYEIALGDVGIQDEGTYHIGAESWLFNNAIGVRAGLSSSSIAGGISLTKISGFGAGLDYALVYPRFEENVSLITHKITVNLATKIPPPKRYDLVVYDDSLWTVPDILNTGREGMIVARVANIERDETRSFKVSAYYTDKAGNHHLISVVDVPGLKGGESTIVEIPWTPPHSDFYAVTVNADDDGSRIPRLSGVIDEVTKDNNSASFEVASFHAPKIDRIDVERERLEISQVSFIKEELPIFPSVYFGKDSYIIPERFNRMLRTLAERLIDNPDVNFKLYGYYDLYTEDDDNASRLAVNRAEAVKRKLVEYGAPQDRITVITSDYDQSMTRATGKEGRRPREASLPAIAEENRRVEFDTEMRMPEVVLANAEIDRGSSTLPNAEISKFKSAAARAKEILNRNRDVELEIIAYSDPECRLAFACVKQIEDEIAAELGFFLQGRTFEAFKERKGEKNEFVLRYSGEPLIYKPLTQANVPEGFRMAEERGNMIVLDGLVSDAPIDTFYIAVVDDRGRTFNVLAHGDGDVPDRVNWNWRSTEGEPPHPARDYYVEFYLRDMLGREISSKSNKLTIDAQRMEHREELVLINFHFAGTSPKSNYIEARIENVAKEIVEHAENEFRSMEVVIGGHTDVIGSDRVNKELSQMRADRELQNLRTYLIKYLNLSDEAGLDNWLRGKNIELKAEGYGPERPYRISVWERGYYQTLKIGNNETPEGRILNRRVSVEIRIKM